MIERPALAIMLVDDEPFMLKLIARMLENLGCGVPSTYTSGAAALTALAGTGGPPNLILLDLQMPGMDGVEFVRHLVEWGYTGSLVLISGEDERMLAAAETLVRSHGLRVLGHLHKPVAPAALSALLGQWTAADAPSSARGADYDAPSLRAAIANGELCNYYQPKVALTNGRVVGVETLVRWRHPVDGLVFPDQFIGIAERHGLIDDLTRVVLREALAQARAWDAAGLGLRVAVNLSMHNLAALPFADAVAAMAAEVGVAPSEIVLEVTESQLQTDLRAPLEILSRLRLKRFRLSIDDFGTGHSSFVQLRDIPFDELKIDRGFVHGAHANPTLHAFVDASLLLARQLQMEVVAEGVEDREDWDFLRRLGCDLAQGYFIARPLPPAALPGWIATWQQRLRESVPALV